VRLAACRPQRASIECAGGQRQLAGSGDDSLGFRPVLASRRDLHPRLALPDTIAYALAVTARPPPAARGALQRRRPAPPTCPDPACERWSGSSEEPINEPRSGSNSGGLVQGGHHTLTFVLPPETEQPGQVATALIDHAAANHPWTRFGIKVVGEPFVERMSDTGYASM
jgi:hypothetical protein